MGTAAQAGAAELKAPPACAKQLSYRSRCRPPLDIKYCACGAGWWAPLQLVCSTAQCRNMMKTASRVFRRKRVACAHSEQPQISRRPTLLVLLAEIADYANFLGIDLQREPQLAWIATEGLQATAHFPFCLLYNRPRLDMTTATLFPTDGRRLSRRSGRLVRLKTLTAWRTASITSTPTPASPSGNTPATRSTGDRGAPSAFTWP